MALLETEILTSAQKPKPDALLDREECKIKRWIVPIARQNTSFTENTVKYRHPIYLLFKAIFLLPIGILEIL